MTGHYQGSLKYLLLVIVCCSWICKYKKVFGGKQTHIKQKWLESLHSKHWNQTKPNQTVLCLLLSPKRKENELIMFPLFFLLQPWYWKIAFSVDFLSRFFIFLFLTLNIVRHCVRQMRVTAIHRLSFNRSTNKRSTSFKRNRLNTVSKPLTFKFLSKLF